MVTYGQVRQVSNSGAERVGVLIVAATWFLASIHLRPAIIAVIGDLIMAALVSIVWLRSSNRLRHVITVEYQVGTYDAVSHGHFTYRSYGLRLPPTELRGPSGELLLQLVPHAKKNTWLVRVPGELRDWNPNLYFREHLRAAFDSEFRNRTLGS